MTRDEMKQHLEDFATSLTLMADRDAKDLIVADVLVKLKEVLNFRAEADFLEHCQSFDPREALARRELQARIRRTTGDLKPVGAASGESSR